VWVLSSWTCKPQEVEGTTSSSILEGRKVLIQYADELWELVSVDFRISFMWDMSVLADTVVIPQEEIARRYVSSHILRAGLLAGRGFDLLTSVHIARFQIDVIIKG
jgi:hypothetical protein